MKKYEFTGETNEQGLKRIRAVRDVRPGVRAGDLGGWIADERNLDHGGESWVFRCAQVYDGALVHGSAQVFGSARVYGEARVCGNALISGTAQVYGIALLSDDAHVFENARVFGGARVFDKARVHGDAQVSGIAEVYGRAQVYGDARVAVSSHSLNISGMPSGTVNLFRTETGYRFVIGCWAGTTDELREMIAGEDWPEADEEERKVRRPQLAALADMIDGIVAAWDK